MLAVHAIVIAFRPKGALSGKSVFGKVGPFHTTEEAEEWCASFRQTAAEQKVDITVLSPNDLKVIQGTESIDYLPSMNADEIIRHAAIPVLFGISG